MDSPTPVISSTNKRVSIPVDLRIVVLILLLIIAAMLLVWKPWISDAAGSRTVTVTGESTVKATPDEYVFYPTYQFRNDDKQVSIDQAAARSTEIIAKLKSLGVSDSQIKSSTAGYNDKYGIEPAISGDETLYTLTLTVTTPNRDDAQKIQDYLVTTAPSGGVSPQPTFSQNKQKQLEVKARDEATKEARTKADQSARNLGFRVDRVKSVDDGGGFDAIPYQTSVGIAEGSTAKLSVQPGENEISYSITVVYYIK